jgi:multiple sugar transport system permease protein
MFSYFNKPERAAYLFILPALSVVTVFLIVPLVFSLFLGFFAVDVFIQDFKFLGPDNFKRLLNDERFWNAMRNTLYYVSLEMPLQVIIALVVAVFVSESTFLQKSLRAFYFVPAVCSMTAVGIVWSLMLDPILGTLPYYLTVLGLPRIQFLRDPVLAMPTIITVTIWKNFGFSMVIFVAGLQSIPSIYYEAATIDGYGKIGQFFRITIPLLLPTLGFVIITTTIGCFQVFDQVYVMTQGGPLFKTETIVQFIYTRAFTRPYELGYASAIAEVLFFLILLISVVMFNFFMKREAEYA